jgi:hypothetical protein
MKDGVNGAFGGNAHIAGKPSDQELADLASAPMRLVALEGQNQAFDLLREVGILPMRVSTICGIRMPLSRSLPVWVSISPERFSDTCAIPPQSGTLISRMIRFARPMISWASASMTR